MSPAGINTMDCGLDKLQSYSLPTVDGYIWPPIPLHSTMSCLDFKANSLDRLILGLMNGKALITTGCIKVLMKSTYGVFPTKCGAGSNSKMVLMFTQLTKLKLDGTSSLTVDKILPFKPDTVKQPLSMSTITISIPMHTLNQEKLVACKEQRMVNS